MVKKTGAVMRAWARPAPAPKAYGESGDGTVGRSGSGGAVLRRRPLAASRTLARRRAADPRGLPLVDPLRVQQQKHAELGRALQVRVDRVHGRTIKKKKNH